MRKTARKLSAIALAAFLSMAVLSGCSNAGLSEDSSSSGDVSTVDLPASSADASSQTAASDAPLQQSSLVSQQSAASPAESSVAPAESSVAPAESSVAPAQSSAAPTESSAPVQTSKPVSTVSTPSSKPSESSKAQTSTATPSGKEISIKEYFDQNGGDELLRTIEQQNSNEQMDVKVYFAGDDLIVFEMQYKQEIPMDEDTKAALVEYFDTNFEAMKPTFRQQLAPMSTLNIRSFSMRVIVKNGDGSLIYQTDLQMDA